MTPPYNFTSRHGLRNLLRLTAFMLVMAFSCPAFAVSPDVVISQVYGGGGNTGATYKNDFIELFNRGTSPVSLNGWSVQYASATGTSWQVTNLTGTLDPGQYYLVQESAGTGGTVNLPTPDATGSIAIASGAGKVALVTNTTTLTGSCPTGQKDFVGFGGANCYEGSGPTPAPSNTAAVLRASNGCTDTDNNSADFSAGTLNPRNKATTINACSPQLNVTLTTAIAGNGGGSISGVTNPYPKGSTATITAAASGSSIFTGWSDCSTATTATITVTMDISKSCTANFTATAPALTIFHVNDTHARVTPHKMIIPVHGAGTGQFEDVGGAAYLAGKMLALTAANPNSLVIDAGDISEGNPIGDMGGNGSMTQFYTLLSGKLLAQRGRGMDAVVVGNHDVRDQTYINNLIALKNSGVPVLSVNVRDINTHKPYFNATNVVTINSTKIGIIGYTIATAEVGPTLKSTLEVVPCAWSGSAVCNISDYVNELRNNQGVDIVVLAAHSGHSALVDPAAPVIADTAVAKVPEVVVTGHWHTIADTVWQPEILNYKTIFTEANSYMKYIGELQITDAGKYFGATNHVIRNADITPDPDVQTLVNNLTTQYNNAHPGHPVDEVVGYTANNLLLDNDMKWWSADEYPWSGNNAAGQWICDAMRWKAEQLFGQCDLAIETGGGVRADIPAGPVTYLQVYETFPWNDDTFVRVDMTGQQIVDFLKTTTLNAGFSSALHVKAYDGVPTEVTFNGTPINLTKKYTVAINNYMFDHPPTGVTFSSTNKLENPALCREGIVDFMRSQHPDQASAYIVGAPRYELNTEYSGGFRAVVMMMNDNDSQSYFEDAFIRLLSATPETLARRGSYQVPADLVNADGSINPKNRLSENEMYRSFLGFKSGVLKPGDIIETWGKGSFYGGNPEFVDQEGIQSDGLEFKIVGHDDSLAKPAFMPSIGAFWNDEHKNRYVQFLATKSATANTVIDQYGQSILLYDATGYAKKTVPGTTGQTVLVSGVPTMESFALRFRCDNITTSALPIPSSVAVTSHVDPVPAATTTPVLPLSATTSTTGASQVQYFARYSADNSAWGAWTPIASATAAPYAASYNLTNYGYYEFSSQATSGGIPESTPALAQAATRYTAAPSYYPTVSIDTLYQKFDGSAKTVSVTTLPAGAAYSVTYNGSANVPVTTGTYLVVATASLNGNTGTASGIMEIGKGDSSISLGNASTTYDGSGKTAAATTSPSGLAVSYTYNGTSAVPVNAGTYTVTATITNPNYHASSTTGTLIITPATATVNLGTLNFTYDGATKSVSATTTPGSLDVTVTYNGSTTAPTAAGTYTVLATVNNPNYIGSATGTMTITAATDAAPVPALGPWGLLAAAAGLGGFAIRRRNNR